MAPLYERYRDLLRRAHLAAARGRREDALADYQAAAAMLPQRAVPRIGIGRMQLAMGDAAAARAAFLEALELEPGSTDARDGLAAIEALGAPTPGTTDPSRPGTPGPTGQGDAPTGPAPWAAVAPDPPALRALADRWDAAHAARDVAALLEAAQGFSGLGRRRAAMLALHDALEADPRDPRAYEVAAWMETHDGRPGRARRLRARLARYLDLADVPADLERDLEAAQAAGDVPAILAIAEQHRRRGRLRTAADALTVALGLAPDRVDVHLAIVRLGHRPGVPPSERVRTSLVLLERLVELDADAAGREQLASFLATEMRSVQ